MDCYNMMNNSYGNIVYSVQTGEITEQQHPNQEHYVHDPNHIYEEGTTQLSVEALKENHFEEQGSIAQENEDLESEAYQEQVQEVNPIEMDQLDTDKNHDEGVEELKENHQSEEVPSAADDANETPANDESKAEEEEEEMKEERLEEDNEAEADNDQQEENSTKNKKEDKVKEEEKDKPKVRRKDGEPADLEICRVCTSKEELSNIFDFESSIRICDIIMKICPTVRITERDHLPHKICQKCVEKVRIASEFKTTCENTDKELRKTLKRAYNKSRRTTDFVIVNCPMSDDEDNDDEPQDDDEYKVSQSEVESEPVTSDDSFEPANKKRRTPKRRGRKPKSESSTPAPTGVKRKRGRQPGFKLSISPSASAVTPRRGPGRPPKSASKTKSPGLANVVYIEAPDASSSDSDDDKPIRQRKTHDCTKCDETFATGVELKEHLQTHKGDLFPCTKCEKTFKSKVYLSNHLERHDQDDKKRAEKMKAKELKKQQQRQKDVQKRREYDSKKPKLPSSSGSAEKKKKLEQPSPANSGRDLFKCVAPLTSTYWSDSFSD
ncbi:cilia- and flagella-associated protein 251 [Wyeomyia smithii]|uniref:cilia- and flagella-associated protein 251 n=1 Tax=Wyeomyia smithii TaxID=174621 RepID=UPI002467EB58|nr:cilia- and flagella-associated protein 251 [Wyeomyia smithii]